MVEQVIDLGTINYLSPTVCKYSDMVAMAINLTDHYKQLKQMSRSDQECFFDLIKVWRERNGDRNATLHHLMKVFLKIRCRVGVEKLIERYDITLDQPIRLVHRKPNSGRV